MTHAGYSGRYVHKTPRAQNSTSMEFIQMSFDIFNFKLLCAFQEGEDKAVGSISKKKTISNSWRG